MAIPLWVKQGINVWRTAAGIEEGPLLRSVSKGKKVGESLSDWAIWAVVTEFAKEIGIERFGAHDLRRTCAKLCRKAGSLHIQVIAAKGRLAAIGGYAKPTTTEIFVLADLPEYAWLKPVVGLLPSDSQRGMGVVLDQRKLRFRKLEMSPEWLHLAYGYDLLVVLPAFTPANL